MTWLKLTLYNHVATFYCSCSHVHILFFLILTSSKISSHFVLRLMCNKYSSLAYSMYVNICVIEHTLLEETASSTLKNNNFTFR